MNEHKKQLVKNFNEIAKQKQKVKKKIFMARNERNV